MMQVSMRSRLVAGTAAVVGATALTLAPVQPLPYGPLAGPHSITAAIDLTATVNPVTRWLEVWDDSEQALAELVSLALVAPLPVVQQSIANQLYFLSNLDDIPGNLQQRFDNLGAALDAPFAQDKGTLDALHKTAFTTLSALLPNLAPLLDFTTTYTSGVLIGLVGPVIAPVLALMESLTNVMEADDFNTALNELVNIPANMVDAFLNGGQTLDLTPLVTLVAPDLPVKSLGIVMGGLLSPGGSIFNSLDVQTKLPLPPISVKGTPAGPIGSSIELSNTIAKAIGWDGKGNPLNPDIVVPGGDSMTTVSTLAATKDDSTAKVGILAAIKDSTSKVSILAPTKDSTSKVSKTLAAKRDALTSKVNKTLAALKDSTSKVSKTLAAKRDNLTSKVNKTLGATK